MKNILVAVMLLVSTLGATAQNWEADISHSSVSFSISHMVISEVEGRFDDFKLSLEADNDAFENARISFEAQIESINTGNQGRDKHLKKPDFFDVERFPTLSFKGKSFRNVKGKNYELKGDLTMHGVTKEVTLQVVFNGVIKDNRGNKRAGFKVEGTLDRYDYGLKYNSVLEAGGLSIGREVQIEAKLEMIQK